MKKKNHHKDGSHLKSNKNSSHGKRHKKDIEKVDLKFSAEFNELSLNF